MLLKNKNKLEKTKKLLKLALAGLVVFGALFLVSLKNAKAEQGVPVIVYGDYINLICEIDDFDEEDRMGDEFYRISGIEDGELQWEEDEEERGETDLEVYIRGQDELSRAQQYQMQVDLAREEAEQREVGKLMCWFARLYRGEDNMSEEEKEACDKYIGEGTEESKEGTKWVENVERKLFIEPIYKVQEFVDSKEKYQDDGLQEILDQKYENAPSALQEGDLILDPNSEDPWGNFIKFVSEPINNLYGTYFTARDMVDRVYQIEQDTRYARDIVAGQGIYPAMDENENITAPSRQIMSLMDSLSQAQADLASNIAYQPPPGSEEYPTRCTIFDDPETCYAPHEEGDEEREDPSIMNILWQQDYMESFELSLEELIDEWFQNLTNIELSILFDLTDDAANRIPGRPGPTPPPGGPPPYNISFLNKLTGHYLKSLFPNPLLTPEIIVVVNNEEKTLSLPQSLIIAINTISDSFFEHTASQLKGNTTIIQDATQNNRLTETSRSVIKSAIRGDFYNIIENEMGLDIREELQNATLDGKPLDNNEITQAIGTINEFIDFDADSITTQIINDIHP